MKKSVCVALVVAAVIVGVTAQVAAAAPPPADTNVYFNDSAALKARMDMRRLWSQHAALTHTYIVSATADLPDAEFVVKRALQNADDIAAAVTTYYSQASAAKLSALLRAHVMLFTDAVRMARMSEKDEMGPVQEKLEGNGREIVSFLSSANPNWKEPDLDDFIDALINHENDELMARIDHDWDGELRAWNDADQHAQKLADMLALGIQRQFPDRFAAAN